MRKIKQTEEEKQSKLESLEHKARNLCVFSMLECFAVMENGHRALISIPQGRLTDLKQVFEELEKLDPFYKGFSNILGTVK
jgi:hypothetical protein